MNTADEVDINTLPLEELPEVLRLALIEDARERLIDSKTQRTRPVSPDRLAVAVGADPVEFQRLCRIALLKLRAQAAELDLDLPDFFQP